VAAAGPSALVNITGFGKGAIRSAFENAGSRYIGKTHPIRHHEDDVPGVFSGSSSPTPPLICPYAYPCRQGTYHDEYNPLAVLHFTLFIEP
jgi:hypothetical protein